MVYYLFSRLYYTTKYLFFQVFFDLTYLTWKKWKKFKKILDTKIKIMYHTENQKFKSSSNYDFSTESLRWWETAKIVFVNGLDRCRGER